MTASKYFYYCEYNDPHLKPDEAHAYFGWNSNKDIHAVKGGFDELECRWLAEEMAEDFHSNHDGWEYQEWNRGNEAMVFFVFDENRKFLFAQAVYLEFEPSFSANPYLVEA